jgi:diaminopropionate ammonia-lyase
MAGLNCGWPSAAAFPTIMWAFDGFVAISDDAARASMRSLHAAGVTAGESGAAGLAGLAAVLGHPATRRAVPLGTSSTVLVLSTEGATDADAYAAIVGLRSGCGRDPRSPIVRGSDASLVELAVEPEGQ